MKDQKHLFQLQQEVHYINCAYMSPLLKSAEAGGMEGMRRRRNPYLFEPDDFFRQTDEVRQKFGRIINGEANRVAIIPSASYGLKAAINNLKAAPGQHALSIKDEFPSGYFSLQRWCQDNDVEMKVVAPEQESGVKGRRWNQKILESIDKDTAVVLMSAVHWADGTHFDLKAIGERCHEVGARFIVDGTQAVGAVPVDIGDLKIDALVCAGYKWLMGPYSFGLAWYGEVFDEGVPLEESWMNRGNARNFSQLTQYDTNYTEAAGRYNVGENSSFILIPMFSAALDQLLDWGIANIEQYCRNLSRPLLDFAQSNGIELEEEEYRSAHIFGLGLPQSTSPQQMMEQLRARNIIVSLRGESVRLSPHTYNTAADMEAVTEVMTKVMN